MVLPPVSYGLRVGMYVLLTCLLLTPLVLTCLLSARLLSCLCPRLLSALGGRLPHVFGHYAHNFAQNGWAPFTATPNETSVQLGRKTDTKLSVKENEGENSGGHCAKHRMGEKKEDSKLI